MVRERPLLIFVSDIHLTDSLHGNAVSKADQLARFWDRIQVVRGKRPAELCVVGDLFDLVRSPSWFDGRARPYHGATQNAVQKTVEAIVDAVLEREKDFFAALRAKISTGELVFHYVVGNHDRLLRFAPAAQAKIAAALGLKKLELHEQIEFRDHGVLAYHGNAGDAINASPDGDSTIGDAIGSELILKFPKKLRSLVGNDHPGIDHIDDIDDVRPVYAVPAWVRQQSAIQPELHKPIRDVWSETVDEFLANDFVARWLKTQHKTFSLDLGKKLRLLLELSRNRVIQHGSDEKMTGLYRIIQHGFDGKMSALAAAQLEKRKGLRYVVNGHSHFPSMQPLGRIGDKPAVYFNTGTWRAVHQIGHDLGGRPSFLPYDAMSYLVFFPNDDKLGRDFEWWTGAMFTAA
ncbi:MAG: metallophosphoesterase [Kofleriaceae bacterium]